MLYRLCFTTILISYVFHRSSAAVAHPYFAKSNILFFSSTATTYCNTGKTWGKTRRPTKQIAIGFPFILHGILLRDVKGGIQAIAGRVTIRWGAYKESSKSLQGIHYYFWRSVALAAECSENIILAKSDCCVDVNCWWWWWWRCFILNERERL